VIGTGYHRLSIGMISGALANDHYRAARSVPLVRRTAGNGAILPLVHKPAKDGCPLPLRSLLSNGCLEGSCFTLPPGTQRPSHYGGKALGRVTFTAVGRMMSVVCDGRKELPAGASREYSSYAATTPMTAKSSSPVLTRPQTQDGSAAIRCEGSFEGENMVLIPPPRRAGGVEEHREITWERTE